MKKSIARFSLAALPALMILMSGTSAFAQCEVSWTANAQMAPKVLADRTHINNYRDQEESFFTEKLDIAKEEMRTRITEFEESMRQWVSDWWLDEMRPSLQAQQKQLSAAELDASKHAGQFTDSRMQSQALLEMQKQEVLANREYRPTELTCAADSMAGALTKSARMSRKLATVMSKERLDRAGTTLARTGTPASQSAAAVVNSQYKEYLDHFCDPAANAGVMPGCASPAAYRNKDVDFGSFLWGEKPTIDLENQDTRRAINAAQSNLVDLRAMDPQKEIETSTPSGNESWIKRRVFEARAQTIYNVFNQMVGERAPSNEAGPLVASLRAYSGTPAANISSTPSYKEIMEALTRDRHRNPEYIAKLVEEPENLLREQGQAQSMQHQVMFDTFDRNAELAFAIMAEYGATLDEKNVMSGVSSAPTQ